MEARGFEFDTHSMSATGFYSSHNSPRDPSPGSRLHDHADYDHSRTYGSRRPKRGPPTLAQQADSLKTPYPSDVVVVHNTKLDRGFQSTPDSDPTLPALSKQAPKGSQYAWKIALDAANALGRGFDVTSDFRLGFAKGSSGSRLVEIDETNTQDIVAPGNVVIPSVSVDIRCDKGEKTHYASEVLTFAQVPSLFLHA